MRDPYDALTSECVTCTMVVPSRFSCVEQLHDFLGLAGVQISRRLVGQKQRRLVNDGARDAHQLLLPAGELAGIQILLGDNLKTVQGVGNHALPLAAGNVLVRQAGGRCSPAPSGRRAGDSSGRPFRSCAWPTRRGPSRFMQVDRLLAEPVLAAPLVIEQCQCIQQRGLPCPRRSHNGDELTLLDGQVDAAQNPGLARAGLVTTFDIF